VNRQSGAPTQLRSDKQADNTIKEHKLREMFRQDRTENFGKSPHYAPQSISWIMLRTEPWLISKVTSSEVYERVYQRRLTAMPSSPVKASSRQLKVLSNGMRAFDLCAFIHHCAAQPPVPLSIALAIAWPMFWPF
jgi:hypothetical protein